MGTIYADDHASGANDGSSWMDAYNHLQDALTETESAEKPVEIWVTQGTHRPDLGGGQDGLQVPYRQYKRRRLGYSQKSCIRHHPRHYNHVWNVDFIMDKTGDVAIC